MKTMLILFLSAILSSPIVWNTDFEKAHKTAVDDKKMILINFCGSDWCGPCIRLKHEILESAAFENYAADHLVLIRADFPRQKKNQLSPEQTKRNEELADKYNPQGDFPLTVLLDSNGKLIKKWEGFPATNPDDFVSEIKAIQTSAK